MFGHEVQSTLSLKDFVTFSYAKIIIAIAGSIVRVAQCLVLVFDLLLLMMHGRERRNR